MKRYIIGIITVITLLSTTACVKIRVDYPEIQLYDLKLPENRAKVVKPLQGSIQIRDIEIPQTHSGNRILLTENGRMRKLYYNRWAASFDDVLSSYFTARIATSELFADGLVSNRSLQKPKYILEARVLRADAVTQDDDKPYEFYVTMTMDCKILETKLQRKGFKTIMSKQYTVRAERENSDPENIAAAFNKAVNTISDKLIADIQKSVGYDMRLMPNEK